MTNSLLKFFKSKIYTAILLLLGLICIGVVGYKYISGLSWLDAVYMTVITITTVGFREVEPMSSSSKIFTIGLILTSLVTVGYAISIITEYILSRINTNDIKQRKMQKQIGTMTNHTIICGYGRNGRQAAKKLMAHNKPFIVIDKDKDIIEKLEEDDILYVNDDAIEDETLIEARIEHANALIIALPSDADNLFVVLSARQINKTIKIISRASQSSSYKKLKLAGANNVILPDSIGGNHMASLVVVPDLVEFVDNLNVIGENNINIEEVKINQLCNVNEVNTIKELDLRKKTGCTVIGFKSEKGDYIVNPEADTKLMLKSKIIVLGRPEQIEKLNSIYNITS